MHVYLYATEVEKPQNDHVSLVLHAGKQVHYSYPLPQCQLEKLDCLSTHSNSDDDMQPLQTDTLMDSV